MLTDQPWAGRVSSPADRPRVGHSHRYAVDAHRQRDAERADQLVDRRHDALPLVVRLGTRQDQEWLPTSVGDAIQQEAGVIKAGPMVAFEGHRRATTAVVDQLVHIEGGQDDMREGGQDVVCHQSLCLAGIDEPAERDHQHRRVQVVQRGVGLDRVELGRVLHRRSPLSDR